MNFKYRKILKINFKRVSKKVYLDNVEELKIINKIIKNRSVLI